mgnify:FL=1
MSKRKRRKRKTNSLNYFLIMIIVFLILSVVVYYVEPFRTYFLNFTSSYVVQEAPTYEGKLYTVLNNNKPNFEESDYTTESFETYSNLDVLGRCGVAFANISQELMPTEDRESISSIKPSGWHSVKYDIVEGKYLYNRCHLIGFQLAGENANEKNLITCTRSMNVDGMLPFEDQVADYVKKTNHHVLYRVTPVFDGNNLVASGVQIEASSVEDRCGDICFNVYVYNVEEGITIDYLTGESKLAIN